MPTLPRPLRRRSTEEKLDKIVEAYREERAQNGLLTENLRMLELEIAGDREFRRLGQALRTEFSRAGLDDIMDASRAMYLVNPLIQRAVNVATYYTWAQGSELKAADEKVTTDIVEPMLEDEGNQLELFSHMATLLTDVDQQVDGNIFLALFTSQAGDVQIRTVPTDQIREIIVDNDDYQRVLFYKRIYTRDEFSMENGSYTSETITCYYPDIRYTPRDQPTDIAGNAIHWDSPIIHQRTGGFKQMRFGIPQTYAALDWARAYKRFLEDWHTIVSSLARFAWKASTKGRKVDAFKDKLTNKSSTPIDEELEPVTDPAPGFRRSTIPGAVAVMDDASDFVPLNTRGATTSAEDAKPSRMMVGSAMDLPDTILSGDPQQGNLATAKTLDRPTELYMVSRQKMWNDFRARIFRYAYDAKVRAGEMPGKVDRTGDITYVEPGLDPSVQTVFPPILEHDVKDTVLAVVTAATLNGYADAGTLPREEVTHLLMSALGVEDIDEAMKTLDTETQAKVAAAVERLAGALSSD